MEKLTGIIARLAGAEGRAELLPSDPEACAETVAGLASLWDVDVADIAPGAPFSAAWDDDA